MTPIDNPSVVKDGSTNNYNVNGMNESDKAYFENMLSTAVKQTSRSSEAIGRPQQTEQRNVIKGNYYGSVVGNIPLVAPGAPIVDMSGIDRLYREAEVRKMQTLEQDKFKFQTMMLGGWNDKFLDLQKQMVDNLYDDYLAVYNDPAIARKAMTSSDDYNNIILKLKGFADDFNHMAKFSMDALTNPDIKNSLNPITVKAMNEFLFNANNIESFVDRDSQGRVRKFNTGKMTSMMSKFQKIPSIIEVAKANTEGIEIITTSELTELAAAGTNKEQVWKYTKEKNKGVDQHIGRLTDIAFGQLGISEDDPNGVEIKNQLRDQIDFNLKRSAEDNFLKVTSDMGKIIGLGVDPKTMQGRTVTKNMATPTGKRGSKEYRDWVGFPTNKVLGSSTNLGTYGGGWVQSTTPGYEGKWIYITSDNFEMSVAGQGKTTYNVTRENINTVPHHVLGELVKQGYLTQVNSKWGPGETVDRDPVGGDGAPVVTVNVGDNRTSYYFSKLGKEVNQVDIEVTEAESRITPQTAETISLKTGNITAVERQTKLRGMVYDPNTGKTTQEVELPDNITTMMPAENVVGNVIAGNESLGTLFYMRGVRGISDDAKVLRTVTGTLTKIVPQTNETTTTPTKETVNTKVEPVKLGFGGQ